MGRKIREIGQDRDVRNRRKRGAQTLVHRPVKVRDQRNDHVRLRIYPMPGEEADGGTVVESNYPVHEPQSLGGAQRPTLRQHLVVNVFETDTSDFTEDIEGVEDLLQVHQAYFPWFVRG